MNKLREIIRNRKMKDKDKEERQHTTARVASKDHLIHKTLIDVIKTTVTYNT